MSYHIYNHKKHMASLHHIPAMIEGFNQILRTPIASFFIIFVITFALFLPAGFYVAWKNVSTLNAVLNQSAQISLYLKKNVTPKTAANIAEQLKLNAAVMDLKLISPDEGIKDFAKHTGFGEILLGVKENPLPYVIIVYPKLSELTQDQTLALIDGLKTLPEVETTKIDMDWVMRSYHFLDLWKYLLLLLEILLSAGAITVVCFTTYITSQFIMNKKTIPKRVLQYQFFWYGLISSLLAISLINFVLMRLHNTGFVLQGLGIKYCLLFILLGILLSVISSKFAIRTRKPLLSKN